MSAHLWQFFLLAALLVCAPAAMLHHNRQVRSQQLFLQLERMAIAGALKKLLSQAQQHRGMVNAYLSGDASFHDKIPLLQRDINAQIDLIAKPMRLTPQHQPPFHAIQGQWNRLRSVALSLSKDENFEKHGSLIQAILNLIREIAEHSQLRRESGCAYSAIETFWHLLPDAAEAIGQARGLGAGVAAAGRCRITERIKLGFLLTRIELALKRVDSGIAHPQASPSARQGLRAAYQTARGRIDDLVQVIEGQLLAGDRSTIQPGHFFEIATASLGSVFALYDQGEAITRQALQHQLSEAQRQCRQSFALFSTALMFLLVSLVYFSKLSPLG